MISLRKSFTFIKNHKGFSLVEVMVGTALMTVAGMSLIGLSRIANQDSVQLRAVRVASMARAQIEAALKNPAAWTKTRDPASNSSFACTDPSGIGCGPAPTTDGYYNFILYGPGGEKITYDPSDPTTRYSIQGGPCQAGTPSPSSLCPIKYVARWKPLCQTAPCQNPTMDIKIDLQLEFGESSPPMDPTKYSYGVVRGFDDGSLQSACQILNGIYNSNGTCRPRNAGKSCPPSEIVTAVASDGTITCSPLYKGSCAAGQVMTGVDASGNAICGTRAAPANCPKACQGNWQGCSSNVCGVPGIQIYQITQPAMFGGTNCSNNTGDTQPCNVGTVCPVNCSGNWTACPVPCGGGTQIFKVSIPAAGTGTPCAFNDGDTQLCNTAACAAPVDCGGYWSGCDPNLGTKTFTVTQAPSGGGLACPSPLTQTCPVDCVGSWGACSGNPSAKTYTWTVAPLNGGISCTYANGTTDKTGCAFSGTWTSFGTTGWCTGNGQSGDFTCKASVGTPCTTPGKVCAGKKTGVYCVELFCM